MSANNLTKEKRLAYLGIITPRAKRRETALIVAIGIIAIIAMYVIHSGVMAYLASL